MAMQATMPLAPFAAAMAVIATLLAGCSDQEMKMSLMYTCTAEGDKGCSDWLQTGTSGTDDDPDLFKVNVAHKCLEYSTKAAGYCKKWQQAGSAIAESDGSGCFPGSALVLTRNGLTPMSKVRIGDELLGKDASSGEAVFSRVRAWIHREVETELEMTVLSTDAGRVVVSHKHSIATDHGSYRFAEELNAGNTLWSSNGAPMLIKETSIESARGLYSPLTTTSNYFVGESEDSMILAHNFAHVSQPQLLQGTLHRIFDMAEFFSPQISTLHDGDVRYAHPLVRWLAPLVGVYL
jgi:hypothetical protein